MLATFAAQRLRRHWEFAPIGAQGEILCMMFWRRFGCCIRPHPRRKSRIAGCLQLALLIAAAAGARGACSNLSDGPGALIVDPAVYSAYHCKDLVAASNQLAARKKELRELIDKAGGGVGTVVSTVAYRSDYDAVLEKEKILKRTAAQKKCQLTPVAPLYRSDQTVH